MNKSQLIALLKTNKILDVRFGYNTLTLVFEQGKELEISCFEVFGDPTLEVRQYVIERKQFGCLELDE